MAVNTCTYVDASCDSSALGMSMRSNVHRGVGLAFSRQLTGLVNVNSREEGCSFFNVHSAPL